MKVGIIGAGRLGRALGARLADAGHELMYAGGASASEAASASGARAGSNSDTVAFGDVVVLAVPFAAVGAALAQAGALEGKVLWSCVNALKPDFSGLTLGFDNSGAEEIAKHAPGARVVAAIPPFAETLASGDLHYDGGLSPTVFVCGDDEHAKTLVEQLLAEIGAHTVDAGPLTVARLVEPSMMLLVSIAYAGVPRDVSLRLLERGA
jgi:predicted dinucleotide-binding enzyme